MYGLNSSRGVVITAAVSKGQVVVYDSATNDLKPSTSFASGDRIAGVALHDAAIGDELQFKTPGGQAFVQVANGETWVGGDTVFMSATSGALSTAVSAATDIVIGRVVPINRNSNGFAGSGMRSVAGNALGTTYIEVHLAGFLTVGF